MATTSPAIDDDLTVRQIDHEVSALSIELDRTTDMATAGDLAARVQALRSMRPVAQDREEADVRHQRTSATKVTARPSRRDGAPGSETSHAGSAPRRVARLGGVSIPAY